MSAKAFQSGSRPTRALLFLVFSLAVFACTADAQDARTPFKVTSQNGTVVGLTVPNGTMPAQLRALVFSLREARRKNELRSLIPPTTPKGAYGPYAVVVVYIMSEERWATSAALRECDQARGGSDFDKECTGRIRAYYFFTTGIGSQREQEQGSVGYAEGSQVRSRPYEKLF